MGTIMKQLLMYRKPPCDGWMWFLSPNKNIAIALPDTWIMNYPPERNEWIIRHECDQYWENGGPQVRGFINIVSGGPKQVREKLEFYQKQCIENDSIMIDDQFMDPLISLPNFGFEARIQNMKAKDRFSGRIHYYAFEESGYILNLRAVCGTQQWPQWQPIFEMCFNNIFTFETKDYWSRN